MMEMFSPKSGIKSGLKISVLQVMDISIDQTNNDSGIKDSQQNEIEHRERSSWWFFFSMKLSSAFSLQRYARSLVPTPPFVLSVCLSLCSCPIPFDSDSRPISLNFFNYQFIRSKGTNISTHSHCQSGIEE